jgi:hypothetical protein
MNTTLEIQGNAEYGSSAKSRICEGSVQSIGVGYPGYHKRTGIDFDAGTVWYKARAGIVDFGCGYRRNTDLCVRGESKSVGMGPLTLPPRATGVLPVQKMHT